MWAFMVSFAAFLVFLMAPVLGAIADFTAAKKRFLRVFAYGGALFAGLLCFVGSGDVVLTMVLFLITQMGFVSANVFYDGFLPEISTPETIDQISARGYAFGYLGGGLQFALSLTLIQVHAELGIGEEAAVKLSLALVGVWWFAFSFVSFRRLRDSGDGHALPPAYQARPRLLAYVSLGFSRTWITARKLLGFKQLSLFLLAFMIYNDGVQTVIAMAAAYATDTLELELWVIMAAMLVIQIVAFVGERWRAVSVPSAPCWCHLDCGASPSSAPSSCPRGPPCGFSFLAPSSGWCWVALSHSVAVCMVR
jgi:UMF1 family MFS transporter